MARNRGGTESIQRKIAALNGVKKSFPDVLANDIKNYFMNSFRLQGWEDEGTQKWEPRKGQVGYSGLAKVAKKSDSSRAILVKTGDLRKSIRVELASWNKLRIVSDLPYSAIHNEGLKGKAFGKHDFTMPKRKFMGRSRKLHNQLKSKMEKTINTAMRA
jgi:phage gpG-like protein